MKFSFLKYILSFVLLVATLSVFAQDEDYAVRPNPPRLVNDLAGVLSADEVARLEQKLDKYNDTTSTQITVLIIPTLKGHAIEEYSIKIAEDWKIGQKGKDNGILILIAMKEHRFRIETGYGMEGTITDIRASEIERNRFIPNFKQGLFYQGIDEATSDIMLMCSGLYKSELKEINGGLTRGQIILIIVVVVMIILIAYNANNNGGGRYGRYSSGGYYGG